MLSGLAVVLLLSYIIWSYRPPQPDLVEYKCCGTDCEIAWTCPTDREQYKCHLLPSGIAKRLPIKHYLIDVKTGPEDQWRTVGIQQHGEQQKYSVPNLVIGSQVEFRVVTVNFLGRRSFPSESSPVFQVVDKPFPPGTPAVEDIIRDESGRSCVRTSCQLRWSPPSSNQGASVSKYKVCQTEDYCSWGLAADLPGYQLSCRLETLQPGTVVQFNIIATNLMGDSKPSDTSPLYYVVGESQPQSPGWTLILHHCPSSDRPRQPKKPWFQEFTTASCSLNWDQPDFDGGCEIIKYIVQRRENHGDWKLYTNFTPQAEKPLALKILGLKV